MSDPRTLFDLLRGLRQCGERPAVIVLDQGRVVAVSYRELCDRGSRRADELLAGNANDRGVIGLMAPNGTAWITTFWGIVAAGRVAVPIDVQAGDDDLRHMIAVAECRLVFAGPGQIDRLRGLGIPCAAIEAELGATPSAGGAALPDPAREFVRPEDLAVLAFTSGTTGKPKAVPLTHANLLSNVTALLAQRVIGPGDRALLPLPLHHTYPLTVGMLTVLASGAAVVFPSGLSGPQLVETLRRCEVTALLGVPRLYAALLVGLRTAAAREAGLRARLFPGLLRLSGLAQRHLGLPMGRWIFRTTRDQIAPTLRLMVCGGAALPPEDEAALTGLGWQVLTGYGLTETSPILTFNRPGQARIGSAGRALQGVSLRIANPGADGIGEIEASGASVFAGYRGDMNATSAAFTPDGWFRTGDLGRIDRGGRLYVVARATETIVLPSGLKIFPEALETAYAQDPLIREIAVLRRAEGLGGLVVPSDEAMREAGAFRLEDRVADALRGRARSLPPHLRLSGFAVTRTPLPRTPLGKLRRYLLPAIYDSTRKPEHATAAAPSDAAILSEPVAVAVWTWLRARYPDRAVELETSPQLDLGIDSLGWIDLTLALQHEFGIALTEQQIARVVTIHDLLREAVAGSAGEGPNGAVADQSVWLEPDGPVSRMARLVGETILRIVMRTYFGLRVEGREKLPEPPFMICPNHTSYIDGFVLAAALPHRRLNGTYWAGWTGLLFATPSERLFSRIAQIVPIDPDRAVAAGIALGVEALARGKTLVWFPEGILSPDGTLQPFQPGIGAVLERRPVPVVPALIRGSADALPPGKSVPRPGRVSVRFGDPIDPASIAPGLAGRARQQRIADALRDAVAALAAGAERGHDEIRGREET
jgi:long-chain acyl-CoA synthetase